ncbi:type II toxin-antitoxin system RatA family toxin [Mycobacterium sp. 134]|uniref:type II toxin-antitoxin system RatA family toxin n=1 Tax=unclassified Mycobacterium TaxID=2642494 RepID=UPI0007FF09A5|nr:SRPBCC family protein [Mycobacterium sp. E802]OBG83426.1 cyclase [Mycobacterium sp. E802]
MPTIELAFHCEAITPAAAFDRIQDFESYPRYTEAVVSVDIEDNDPHAVISVWTVRFRKGLLRWTERDDIRRDVATIDFCQVSGDFKTFQGSWRVREEEQGATIVYFTAEFDLGMPSLAELLDPIAAAALAENIELILGGLFGAVRQVDPTIAA